MTRLDRYFLPTEREAPADAEALSHKLGVRAGLVRQVGSGLWSWLPAGWRVHENVAQIVREECNRIGCQEMLMPVITPAELWRRSGRYDIEEVFKLKDRRGADLILALSHEETVTLHVAQTVRSYRQLPMLLYHFQTKGRDEARPRAGVLRTREFIMKDAYSFDRDDEGLQASYEKFIAAYDAICDRTGLEWYRVESDVGMMGGSGAHEYMAPCPAGENDVALAPGYAANTEVASADPQPVAPMDLDGDDCTRRERRRSPPWPTPSASTPGNVLKAFPVVTESRGLIMAFVRGDHRVNEVKLANALGEAFRPAREDELPGPGGFLGPTPDLPALYDDAIVPGQAYLTGANRPDYHRVVTVDGGERGDVRTVEVGDTVNGNPIRIEPAIEIGNIFKLGTRYSEPLGATYLDENGKEQLIVMGSYGIGPARITAAAIEQYADEKGISWPRAIAPWDVEIVAIGKPGTPERDAAEALYAELCEAGLEVLLDDRDAGPGEKFADAELLGVPAAADGRQALARVRARGGAGPPRPRRPRRRRAAAGRGRGRPRAVGESPVERRRLSFGRLVGVDRSGPPPPQTLPGAPLNLWTIPNAIGMVRLGLLPIFLVVSFSSDSGIGVWPAVLFGVAGWTDYFDGIAARVTGQYSRFGTLLDPVVDRLLVLCGVIACWYHDLLPRWALAILVARELFMLIAGRYALRRGIEIRVNMVGRLAIWPVLSALEFAFCGLETLSTVLFYIGLAMTLVATAMYVRDARPSTSA